MNSEAFVTLAGLTGRPYLNGQRGHVQGHQGDRIVVMLQNGEVRMRQFFLQANLNATNNREAIRNEIQTRFFARCR